jgi:hypothetical protein
MIEQKNKDSAAGAPRTATTPSRSKRRRENPRIRGLFARGFGGSPPSG